MKEAPIESDIAFEVKSLGNNQFQFINKTTGIIAYWKFHNGQEASGDNALIYIPFAGDYQGTVTLYGNGGSIEKAIAYNVGNDDPALCNNTTFQLLAGGCELGKKTWRWNPNVDGFYKVLNPDNPAEVWYSAPANGQDAELFNDSLVFSMNGRYDLIDQGVTVINWSWYDEITGLGDKPQYNDSPGSTVAYRAKLGNDFAWTVNTVEGKQYIEISNGGWMSFFNGQSKYEIVKLTEDELVVRSIYRSASNPLSINEVNGHEFMFIKQK
jgi:hypothetical protein